MYIFLNVLIIIAAILLILIVLVQKSKGGGLAADFSGGNNIMGVRKTTDFLEKATWVLAGAIIVLSVFAVGVHKNETDVQPGQNSMISEQAQEAQQSQATAAPSFDENAAAEQPVQQEAE